jgi:hypothetical protein
MACVIFWVPHTAMGGCPLTNHPAGSCQQRLVINVSSVRSSCFLHVVRLLYCMLYLAVAAACTLQVCLPGASCRKHLNQGQRRTNLLQSTVEHLHTASRAVRERRDGALALLDLRLLLIKQPPGKLGGSYIFFFCIQPASAALKPKTSAAPAVQLDVVTEANPGSRH